MAKTVTLKLKGRTPVTHGRGPRVIEGLMSLAPASEALHAEDVELRSIDALFIEQTAIGSFIETKLVNPGSYGNYASFAMMNLATGEVPAARAGSVSVRFLALGE